LVPPLRLISSESRPPAIFRRKPVDSSHERESSLLGVSALPSSQSPGSLVRLALRTQYTPDLSEATLRILGLVGRFGRVSPSHCIRISSAANVCLGWSDPTNHVGRVRAPNSGVAPAQACRRAAPTLCALQFLSCSLLSCFCGSMSEPRGERDSDLCLSCDVHHGNAKTQEMGDAHGASRTPLLSRSHREQQK
jgi:hypothetical protein